MTRLIGYSKRKKDLAIEHYRVGTDDDRFVIPEILDKDMYQFRGKLSRFLQGRNGHLVDCGAHIGVFSRLCVEYMSDVSILHCFEPQPENYRLLRKNLSAFEEEEPGRIVMHQKAVALENGTIRLFNGSDTGRFTCVPVVNHNDSIEVECIDLADYLRKLDKVLILKLDLEGFEARILNVAAEKILRNVEVLILEEHHEPINHDLIKANGFRLWYEPTTLDPSRRFVRTWLRKSFGLSSSSSRHFVYKRME